LPGLPWPAWKRAKALILGIHYRTERSVQLLPPVMGIAKGRRADEH